MKLLSERLAHLYELKPDLEGDRGQTGLVRASGASKSVVNQWLNGGIKSMDILYALELEAQLGVSHIWLMTGLGEPLVTDWEKRGWGRMPETGEDENPVLVALKTDDLLRVLTAYQLTDSKGRDAFHATADAILQRVDRISRNKT